MINIDLSGPDGNCFQLLAIAKELSYALDKDFSVIKADMVSSIDYENLLDVFDEWFSEVATLLNR